MAARTMTVPFDKIAGQIGELLVNGGTLGDVYGYDERDYEVLYALGHSLYSQGRYADAMKAFGFLVMHNHLERRFAAAYASSLQMIKQYDKAIEFYTLASVMDMSDPVPTFHTAECMMQLGMMDEAKEALGFVVKQGGKPEHAELKQRAQAMLGLLESEGVK
jgi:type III secretion system low calcium response chaperone LcrH/SycD